LPKSNNEHNQALGENPRSEGLPLALSSGRLKTCDISMLRNDRIYTVSRS
jgi:hypothetical protein